jgi:hypothetical protein
MQRFKQWTTFTGHAAAEQPLEPESYAVIRQRR